MAPEEGMHIDLPQKYQPRTNFSFTFDIFGSTVVLGFSVLGFRALPGFRALNAGNQIWFYVIDLPGFRALPVFKAPFYGDGRSALNPGTTL